MLGSDNCLAANSTSTISGDLVVDGSDSINGGSDLVFPINKVRGGTIVGWLV
jgi:hypothetical protein